jgi:hypothetical protein
MQTLRNACLVRSIALTISAACLACVADWALADEPIYSGPQPGEALPALPVVGVFDERAGKEWDVVEECAGRPTLLIFVHQLTRPSASLTRVLARYAASRKDDGLACGVIWLTADRSETEQYLKRARESLAIEASVGISSDGAEGPGAYGLNRNVGLTVLVANEGKVTANYALIQPSVTDAPAILKEVVALVGGEVPALEELQPAPAGRRRNP